VQDGMLAWNVRLYKQAFVQASGVPAPWLYEG
jgi:hypothetical protein